MNKKILSIVLVLTMILSVALPIGTAMAAAPTMTLKVGSTFVSNGQTYSFTAGQTVTLSATHVDGIKSITYRLGTNDLVTVQGNSTVISIPASYTNAGTFTVNAYATANDNTTSSWYQYILSVTGTSTTTQTRPVATMSLNGTVLNTGTVYTLTQGQTLNITGSHSTGIKSITYRIGTNDLVTVNSSSATISIPTSYTNAGQFSVNMYVTANDGNASLWQQYIIQVTSNSTGTNVRPVATMSVNGVQLTPGVAYTVAVGQTVQVAASHSTGIKSITYRVGTNDLVTVTGSVANISIPASYADKGTFSINMYATANDGNASLWQQYVVSYTSSGTSTVRPVTKVMLNGVELLPGVSTIIKPTDSITISASHSAGVNQIVYRLGTMELTTVNASTATVTIPAYFVNAGPFSLNVYSVATNGNASLWQQYAFESKDGNENTKYPVIILADEKYNNNVNTLAVALRNVPSLTKTGNKNYYVVNENVQYNIDFINAGNAITEKVYVDFTVPTGFSVEFVDAKGGVALSSNTIRWEFNGLAKGEKGTIPLILRYTAVTGSSIIATPFAKITAGTASDISAALTLVTKSSSTVVSTSHKAYMIGDAGTNTFRPYDGINRAEVAQVLVRIFNLPLVQTNTVSYNDKAEFEKGQYAWSKQAVMTATQYGLMEGYEDGTFRPGDKVTKAQLITILARKFATDANIALADQHNAFVIKDQPIKLFNNLNSTYYTYGYDSHWSTKYLAQMIRLNMLPDFANTIDGNIDLAVSRAEAAKVINTVLFRGPSTDNTNGSLTVKFVDVDMYTSNYAHILEASANTHDSMFTVDGKEIMVK